MSKKEAHCVEELKFLWNVSFFEGKGGRKNKMKLRIHSSKIDY